MQFTTADGATVALYGIRHHGPGSARALRQALHAFAPDALLVEGPPDANAHLDWITDAEMTPPVALLVYRPDQPQRFTYYPFAIFSPEWQALRYGLTHAVPTQFFDLPQAHTLAQDAKPQPPDTAVFAQLAAATGYRSYEAWWNLAIEQRRSSDDLFTAVMTLMAELRAAAGSPLAADPETAAAIRLAAQREAHMRRTIRQTLAAGKRRVAVVVGAWHAPALRNLNTAAADDALLADCAHADVDVAWVPWTYGRLSTATGYGAGIHSPGWYHHLWEMDPTQTTATDISVTWLARVAGLLRDAGLDASSAHVIEAVRLAESLAALRERPFPGLPELNEATQTVLCFGSDAEMKLVRRKLIVSERMGRVPPDSPLTPLQRDLAAQQQALALPPQPEPETITLDLRQPRDLARSHLLHRLDLLRIGWGTLQPIRQQSGTYQEMWRLHWQPEHAILVVEASLWGNTVADAAAAFAQDGADKAETLPALTTLLDQIILADLPQAVAHLMARIEDEAAVSGDVPHMMDALGPLARVLRYGSVRQTDRSVVGRVVDGLITRICIGLPSTVAALDDAAAAELYEKVTAVHSIILTLQIDAHREAWFGVLRKLADQDGLHGLLAGRVCRLLLDAKLFTPSETAVRLNRALSLHAMTQMSTERLSQMAAWIDGFLRDSGLVLVHDQTLWELIDSWLMALPDDQFQTALPLLRRTFSTFTEAVRQQLHERVRAGSKREAAPPETAVRFDADRAAAVLPLAAQLLGLRYPPPTSIEDADERG